MAENRRVRMTKKMIKNAYLDLLEQFPSEKISVTDICKTADVNRSTFYMYYQDTVQLRREIEDEILDQIPVVVNLSDSVESNQEFIGMLESFFTYIQKNERLFRALLLQSDNRRFNRRLIEAVLEKYQEEYDTKDQLIAEYSYVYCVSGVVGILENWIENGFPLSAREFSEIAFKMSFMANGIMEHLENREKQ